MEKGMRLMLILFVISISFVSATAIGNSLHLNIQTTNSTGIATGTFVFGFNISTSSDCATANVVYADASSLATDTRGIISYYLDNVNLNFSDQYYLCYYRNNVLISASKIARTPYSFQTKNASTSGLIADANFDMGDYDLTTNGGWTNNGVTISGGDVYAQTLFVYNITALNVNNLYVNGSLFPPKSATFDIGSSTLKWKDLYLSGTITAGYLLHLGSGSPVEIWLDQTGGGNTNRKITANGGSMIFSSDSTDQMWIDSSGDVGIGTIPYHDLVLFRDGTTPIFSIDRSGIGTMHFGVDSSGQGVISTNGATGSSNNNITFRTGVTYNGDITSTGTEVMRITDAGRVGIGTTNPAYHLEVNKSQTAMNISGILYVNSSNFGNNVGIGTPAPRYPLHLYSSIGSMYSVIQTTHGASEAGEVYKNANQAWTIGVSSPAINDVFGISLSEGIGTIPRFKIDTDGQVGIGMGTTMPAYLLEIGNNETAMNVSGLLYVDSTNELVGIGGFTSDRLTRIEGLTAYGKALHLASDDLNSIRLTNTVSGSDFVFTQEYDPTRSHYGSIGSLSSNSMVIKTYNTQRMIITSTGNVGIGGNMSAPAYMLEINNSAKSLNVSSFLYANSSNVWINSTNPIYLFQVGKIIYANSSAIGFGTSPFADYRVTVSGSAAFSQHIVTTSAISAGIDGPPAAAALVEYNKFGGGAPDSGQITTREDVYVTDDLEVDGTLYLTGGYGAIINADVAEVLLTIDGRNHVLCEGKAGCVVESYTKELEFGDVVCIDTRYGQVIKKCDDGANSHLVAGVVSNTSVINMGNNEKYGYPIAVAGIVFTKVSNENGVIYPGDLLVSASKPGYAMKAPENYKIGTILGKAFDFCDARYHDECLIPMFVALG